MNEKNTNQKYNIFIKSLLIILSIGFVVPSIFYMLERKTVLNFDKELYFLLNDTNKIFQAEVYLVLITLFILVYYLIIKKRKVLFKDINSVFKYIFVISMFFVFVIPFDSSDIYYYLGVGRLESEYGQNPYYISMKEYFDNNIIDLSNDTVMQQGYNTFWAHETVVYGPVWTIACRFIATLSMGNIDFGLLLFKIFNLFAHMLTCYFIYKISKKKIFVLAYGLNPFVLLQTLASVHNDVFVVLFILIAIYMLLKKKNLYISVIFIALATAIKYFAILFLPFLVIYYFRNDKPGKRILNCIKYGTFFVIILFVTYLFYIKDINVLLGLVTQQEKISKNIYLVFSNSNVELLKALVTDMAFFLLVIFANIYCIECIALLFREKVSFKKEMKKMFYTLMIFIFLLITNFQPWYLMWFFTIFMWQKPNNMRLTIQMQIASLYANTIFLAYFDNLKCSLIFVYLFYSQIMIFSIANRLRSKKKQ